MGVGRPVGVSMSWRFEPGDRVRVTVPDPTDPDHHYHGAVGTITAVRDQPLAPATGEVKAIRCIASPLTTTKTECGFAARISSTRRHSTDSRSSLTSQFRVA